MNERRIVLLAALSLMCACSQAPKKEVVKEPEKPAEPVTGRYAFHQVYINARSWAADLQPLRMQSLQVPGVTPQPGKAGAWEVIFISASKGKSRSYTYSVIEAGGNLHKGVFGNVDEFYSKSGQAVPWNIAALKVDSDAAYETAAKKSEKYIKANPDKPVTFLLEQTSRHPFLTWRVIWGESVGTSNYSVYVSASTGEYLETMR